MCTFLGSFLCDYLWFTMYRLTTKMNSFLITFARVHILDPSPQIILDRKWTLAWPQHSLQHSQSHSGSNSSFIRTEHLPNTEMKEWNPNGPNGSGNQPTNQKTYQLSAKTPVWSDHPRWLFSCPLYIPCLTSASFNYTSSRDWPSYMLVPEPSEWLF